MASKEFPSQKDFIRIMSFTIVCFSLIKMYKYTQGEGSIGRNLMLSIDMLYYGAVIVYCAFRCNAFRPFEDTRTSIRSLVSLGPSVVLLLSVGLVGGGISSGLEMLLPEFLQVDYPIMWFIPTVVIAPIAEEVIFRGYVFNGLEKRFSAKKTILLSAMMFGACHIYPQFILYGFIGGLALGYIYYHTRSLLICIIAHASVNFVGWKVHSHTITEAAGLTERSIFADVSAAIILVFVLYFMISFSIATIQKHSVMNCQ